MLDKKKLIKIGLDFFVAGLLVVFVAVILPKILIYFLPFTIGFIISIIANPIVKFLEKRVKIVRKHSSALIIIFVIGVVCLGLYLLGGLIVKESIQFAKDVPDLVVSMKEQMAGTIDKASGIYNKMPDGVKNYIIAIKDEVSSGGVSFPKISISGASSAVKMVVNGVVILIFTVLSAYFFTADREEILGFIHEKLPKSVFEKVGMITSYFTTAVGGYFKAQFKIMIVLVAIMNVVFVILGVEHGFLISLGTGLLDLLPVFGAGAVLWPWALYSFLVGNYSRAIALMVLYFVCQLVKQLLQPKMVGDSIGLPPLTTLFLLFIGYKIGGLLGILISIPLGLIVINLYRAGTFDVLIEDIKYLYNLIWKVMKDEETRE